MQDDIYPANGGENIIIFGQVSPDHIKTLLLVGSEDTTVLGRIKGKGFDYETVQALE